MAKKKSKKGTYHHGDLRNHLIQAGLEILSRDGIQGLSLRKVAKEAGVSHTAPYRHFDDKEALLSAIAMDGFAELTRLLDAAYEKNLDEPEAMLIDAGVAYVTLAVSKPDTVRLMFGGSLSMAKVQEEVERFSQEQPESQNPYLAYESLLRIVVHGQEKGAFIEVPSRELALLIWSSVHGLAMLLSGEQLKEPPETREEVEALTRRISELLLVGVIHRK